MYRLVTLVCTLWLAVCQHSPANSDSEYIPGKEYVYDYESQVLSGMPDGANTYSGLKIKSQILIQMTSPSKIKLQLTSPRLYKINDLVDSKDPTKEMLPSEMFQELLDEDSEQTKQQLQKPISVSYERGHVDNLVTEGDDPQHSVNVKKGVLSLLELNFNDRHSLDKDVSVVSSDGRPKVYRVVEPSVAGECQTMYKFKAERSDDGRPSMKIEKVRDFNKCIEKVVQLRGLLMGKPCTICQASEASDPVLAQSSVKYSVLGSPYQFVIVSASATSQYHVQPFAENRGKVSSFAHQRLSLTDSRPTSTQIKEPQSPRTQEQAIKAAINSDQDSAMASSQQEKDEAVKKVEKILAGLEEMLKDNVEEDSGDLLQELTSQLKKLDKPSLDKVLDKALKDKSRQKSRKAVIDVLSMLGTFPSVDALLERASKKEISEDSETLILMTLGLIPHPDASIVKRLRDHLESMESKDRASELKTRVGFLALSALGNKMSQQQQQSSQDQENQIKQVKQLRQEANDKTLRQHLDRRAEEIKTHQAQAEKLHNTEKHSIKEIVKRLMGKSDDDSQVLAMKMAANLGDSDLSDVIEPKIRDRSASVLQRMEAVTSLQKMAMDDSEKVQKILLPVLLDRSEAEEVRSAAYITILSSKPSAASLQAIAKSLEDEPSSNIISLVYSSLLALSNQTSTCSCSQSLSKNSSMALHFGRKPSEKSQQSSLSYQSSFDKDLKMGHSYMLAVVKSSQERSPRAVAAQYSALIAGRYLDVIEVGMKAKGLDAFIDEVTRQADGTGVDAVIKAVLSPRQRGSSQPSERRIQEIKDKLGVSSHHSERPEGQVSAKLFGNELVYIALKSAQNSASSSQSFDTQEFISQLKQGLDIIEILKKLLKSEISYTLPLLQGKLLTETGLPVSVKIDKQGIIQSAGDISTATQGASSSKHSLFGNTRLDVKFKPSALMEIRGSVETDLKHVVSGVQVRGRAHVSLPLSVSVSIDPDKSKVKARINDQSIKKPVKLESRVHTVVRQEPSKAADYPGQTDRKEITSIDSADLSSFSLEAREDTMGRKLRVSGEYSARRDDSVPFPPLSGRHTVQVSYEQSKASDIDLQIQMASGSEDGRSKRSSNSEQTSWWSAFFSAPDDSTANAERSASSGARRASSRSNEDFIDLDSQDLSTDYLKEKFQKDTEIQMSGAKTGLVATIRAAGSRSDQQVQISALKQADRSGRKTSYTVEVKRAASGDEQNPQRVLADLRVDLPDRDVEPSDLADSQYQQGIKRQMRLLFSDDGKRIDTVLDLSSNIITESVREVKKAIKSDRQDRISDNLVDDLAGKAADQGDQQLKNLVQEQRKIEEDAQKQRKKQSDPKTSKEDVESTKSAIGRAKAVLSVVKKTLGKTRVGDQQPEDSIRILCILASQEKTKSSIKEKAAKLQSVMSESEKRDIARELQEMDADIKDAREQQRKHSSSKQQADEHRARTETSPEERNIHSALMDTEKKLISFSTKQSTKQAIDQESLESIDSLSSDIQKLKKKIDNRISSAGRLSEAVKSKLLEVALRLRLASELVQSDIKDIDTQRSIMSVTQQSSASKDSVEARKKEISKRQQRLHQAARDLSERLAVAVEEEREGQSLQAQLSPQDEKRLSDLRKVHVKQLGCVDQLARKSQQSSDSKGDSDISKESLQDIAAAISESNKQLQDIIEQEKKDKDSAYVSIHVVIKTLKVSARQEEIARRINQIAHKKVEGSAEASDADLQAYKQIKSDTEKSQDEASRLTSRAKNIVQQESEERGRDQSDRGGASQAASRQQSTSQGGDASRKQSTSQGGQAKQDQASSAADTLKKAHMIESKQMGVKSSLQKIADSQGGLASQASDSRDAQSQSVAEKQHIYEAISKLQKIQSGIDQVHNSVRQAASQSGAQDRVAQQISAAKERQDTQDKLVKDLERKLSSRISSDSSLSQALQKVTELKEQSARRQEDLESLRKQVEAQAREQASNQVSDSAGSQQRDSRREESFRQAAQQSSASQQSGMSQEVTAKLKIKHGAEDNTEKTISVLIYGKKSLEQLMFESDQMSPARRDRQVERYMKDRRAADDATSPGYQKLKDELNAYRHIHVSVAHEDSIPREIKEAMLKAHELIKQTYQNKLSVQLPDESSASNRLDITVEIRRDDRYTDAEVRSPRETAVFRNIRTPKIIKDTWLLDSPAEMALSAMSLSSQPASCAASSDRVKTWKDQAIEIRVMADRCEKVLAADCSPSNDLAVTSKPADSDPDKQVITVYTKDRKIELIPDSDSASDSSAAQAARSSSHRDQDDSQSGQKQDSRSVRVKVDGQDVDLAQHQSSSLRASADKKEVQVEKGRDGSVQVKIPHLGVSVRSDGHQALIRVPQTYFSKLCGICGSLDGDEAGQQAGPQGARFSQSEAFISSYLIPEGQCNAQQLHAKYRVQESRAQSMSFEPKEETEVKKIIKNGIPRLCFSTVPIRKCLAGSKAASSTTKLVPFHCVRSTSSTAEQYQKAAKSRVLDEVRDKKANSYDNISQPTRCVPA